MESLPDELIIIICQYALCPAHGLWLACKASSEYEKCEVRYQRRSRAAMGLIFTNRRLSRIAIPILYGENTFCFSTELRVMVEFFMALPRKSLKRIKEIYISDKHLSGWEEESDGLLVSHFMCVLRQMALDRFSIAMPLSMQDTMMIGRNWGYPSSNHGQLSRVALSMLKHDRLDEVRIVHGSRNRPESWEGEAEMFGDDIVKGFVEPIILDRETYKDAQERREIYATQKFGTSYNRYDIEEAGQRRRAAYKDMLISVKSVWESSGVTVERENNYLRTYRPTIVIKKMEIQKS